MAKQTERIAMRKVERKGSRTQSRAERLAAVEQYERKRQQPQEAEHRLESPQPGSAVA